MGKDLTELSLLYQWSQGTWEADEAGSQGPGVDIDKLGWTSPVC